jgi:hypothetical protein
MWICCEKQKFSEGCTSGYHDDSDDVIVLKDKVIIVFNVKCFVVITFRFGTVYTFHKPLLDLIDAKNK